MSINSTGKTQAGFDAMVANISGALKACSTPDDIMTYRGIKDVSYLFPNTKAIQVGHVVKEKGFFSTSLNETKANDFTSGGTVPCKLKIRVPAGTQGAYVNAANLSPYPEEREFLIPHGNANYKIVKVEYDTQYDMFTSQSVERVVLTVDLIP